MESILTSIKKLLGITEDYTCFDPDIIMCINSAFATLTQLGAGPPEGFRITDKSTLWSDYLPDNPRLDFIKSYVHLKTKLLFDPPTASPLLDSINKMLAEFEYRIRTDIEDYKP